MAAARREFRLDLLVHAVYGRCTDCSDAQISPLSKVLEWMIELTASSHVGRSSMMAGVLPAPTPRAGLPEE